MGVYLGQLPPAELARFKAELAETLIANFCYPRFFDYRTESLRMRPVDRAKRQEVWSYLNTIDLATLSRVDLLSADFQTQIERLFIQFVQRNRSFFGEQGRKRMGDVRMLIGFSAASVVQGLRGHLTGQPPANAQFAFGSPRPVVSWAGTKGQIQAQAEVSWEQIAPSVMLLQQQLQEVRGEIKPAAPSPTSEGRTTSRRIRGGQASATVASNGFEAQVQPPIPGGRSAASINARIPATPSGARGTVPLQPTWSATPTPAPARPISRETSQVQFPEQFQVSTVPAVQPSAFPLPTSNVPAPQHDTTAALVSEEDIAIFEQIRHQLMVWLRIEAVRAGMDISGLGPAQLLEILRQQAQYDETQLQVVSTLLDLSAQVLKNGHASLLDYKQALMYQLIHARNSK